MYDENIHLRGVALPHLLRSPSSKSQPLFTLIKLAVNTDYYQVLSITRNASTRDIKTAYHRALLNFHPDKRHTNRSSSEAEPEISLIKEAYVTLSVPESRSEYDSLLLNRERQRAGPGFTGSRPAQVVSLEEFQAEYRHSHTEASASAMVEEWEEWATYTYPCRCGGMYKLTTDDLENGHHLIGCESCSEVIWIGYEEVVEQ